jgi:glucose/arabinose dehydrogenase
VSGRPSLAAERVADGLAEPTDIQHAGDRSRLYVTERPGRVRVLRGGVLQEAPLLDIAGRVSTAVTQEQGMLGLAFHPRFSENGRFYVNYTSVGNQTRIAEFRVAPGAETADPATERVLLAVDQPFYSHLGGQLRFGRDERLYIALGDGGSAGDPLGVAQSLDSLLGKILRIDPDGAPYVVPLDNPFVLNPRARREIWALGLRNPWRFAFDPASGDLVIGDVGQRHFEEINLGRAARGGGENYGWAVMEGDRCFPQDVPCDRSSLAAPILTYGHGDGCAVTGGVFYEGCRMPGYANTYFFGDHCTGAVHSFRLQDGRVVDLQEHTESLGPMERLTTFGQDAAGEVYLAVLSGAVYRLVPRP